MSTSGTYTSFSMSATDIINRAAAKLGLLDEGETISPAGLVDALTNLNILVKQMMQAEGMGLWLRQSATLYLDSGTESYSLGPSGDHFTNNPQLTTLSAAASSGATTVDVTSATNIAASDNIGIKLDDGTIQWTTVSSIASTTLTLAAALTGSAASGNNVYSYTDKGERPQNIIQVFRRDSSDIDTQVRLVGRHDYDWLADKSSTGPVTQVAYEPDLTNGTLYVWPTGDSDFDRLIMTVEGPVMDFDSASNNPQFPIEWANCLVWRLADEMAPEYGLPLQERQVIAAKAAGLTQMLEAYNTEDGSVSFGMETL